VWSLEWLTNVRKLIVQYSHIFGRIHLSLSTFYWLTNKNLSKKILCGIILTVIEVCVEVSKKASILKRISLMHLHSKYGKKTSHLSITATQHGKPQLAGKTAPNHMNSLRHNTYDSKTTLQNRHNGLEYKCFSHFEYMIRHIPISHRHTQSVSYTT